MTLQLVKPLRVKYYNGMQFQDWVDFPPVKHEFAVSVDYKRVISRPLILQTHQRSYAYEPELLLSSWSYQYPVDEPRGVYDSKWWRTEQILSPIHDFDKIRQLYDSFMDAAMICKAILEGVI